MELVEFSFNYWIVIIPLLGALAGWLIHHIAATVFIWRVLPSKKEKISQEIGRIAAREFAAFNGLEEKINDPSHFQKILPTIEQHVDYFLNEKLKEQMPMISMFIGNKTTDKLKAVFLEELEKLFPQVIGQFAANLKSGIDVEKMVSGRIRAIPPAELSKLAANSLKKELYYFRLLGAVTGLLVGALPVIINMFL